MEIHLEKSKIKSHSTIHITGSKSETNRLLLLQALFQSIKLENISNSDDSLVMIQALTNHSTNTQPQLIDVHHAGTAMRFLTAYFSIQEGREILLTGSNRMKERPIKILVESLQKLGADITYLEEFGFPPLKIKGKKLSQAEISIEANVSSQYISALLLIAPRLENGLQLTLKGSVTSIPYIKMTLQLLNEIGVITSFCDNKIVVEPLINSSVPIDKKEYTVTVESDWSSASYWYSVVALSDIGTQITLSSYKQNSLQGDGILASIYYDLGVETVFHQNQSITLTKIKKHSSELSGQHTQLNNSPDIVQTIAVSCYALGMSCNLTGLHTLKIKETDRLEALKEELTKLGANVTITNDSLTLEQSPAPLPNIRIKTYQDHRMAMAFAPLALKVPIIIEEAEVVSKSYPDFWKDFESVGFTFVVS